MRTLYLFRHAKASEGAGGPGDHERPLTEAGVAAARAVGAALKAGGHDLGFVLSSTARRAAETYENVAHAYSGLGATFDRAVYEGDARKLLQRVQTFPDTAATATVFGHNPAHHDLAVLLATHGAPKQIQQLAHSVPPGSVARIDFDVARWEHIAAELGTLALLLRPQDLVGA